MAKNEPFLNWFFEDSAQMMTQGVIIEGLAGETEDRRQKTFPLIIDYLLLIIREVNAERVEATLSGGTFGFSLLDFRDKMNCNIRNSWIVMRKTKNEPGTTSDEFI